MSLPIGWGEKKEEREREKEKEGWRITVEAKGPRENSVLGVGEEGMSKWNQRCAAKEGKGWERGGRR